MALSAFSPSSSSQNPPSSAHSTTPRGFPYFADGNIVISATVGEGGVQVFRVHSSVLAYHSPVFADMFSLPPSLSGTNTNEVFDGVPMVYMPDAAVDLAQLLGVLYNPSTLPFERFHPDTPLRIRGVLKLATKYQIEHLRSRIVKHIEADWPSTLSDWDVLEDHIESMKRRNRTSDPIFDAQLPEPAAAIRLARECDIPGILPAAFYHLSRIHPEMDWDECRSVTVPLELLSNLRKGERSARWDLLDKRDLMRLLHGIRNIQWSEVIIYESMETFTAECTNAKGCHTIIKSFCRRRDKQDRDPLAYLRDRFTFSRLIADQLCDKCATTISTCVQRNRQTFWEELPNLFRLSS
ncbi:hypothetical protein JAAARDRAFT_143067 [Jaapia argillacea MUCL 33604]|uniref:BTB domain-containing protein n=1 Tax=Jaapia argillacea MUCL 33604 TaxID=933084 RepID=A0A067P440_9AGAM|nr:hypothetical protein JAAARDRAFT_143067 [Jaapia argillacea MUCL 33604]